MFIAFFGILRCIVFITPLLSANSQPLSAVYDVMRYEIIMIIANEMDRMSSSSLQNKFFPFIHSFTVPFENFLKLCLMRCMIKNLKNIKMCVSVKSCCPCTCIQQRAVRDTQCSIECNYNKNAREKKKEAKNK